MNEEQQPILLSGKPDPAVAHVVAFGSQFHPINIEKSYLSDRLL